MAHCKGTMIIMFAGDTSQVASGNDAMEHAINK